MCALTFHFDVRENYLLWEWLSKFVPFQSYLTKYIMLTRVQRERSGSRAIPNCEYFGVFSNWFFYATSFQVWTTRASTTAFRRSASTRSHWRRRRRRRRTTTTATTATPTAPSSVGAAPTRRWRGAPCTACSASLRSSGAATPPSRRSARYAERRRRLLPFLNHVPRFENRTEIHWNRTWFRLQFFYVILMNFSVAKKHFKNYTAGCT